MGSSVQEFPHSTKPKGLATILAIGTSNPPNVILQKDFPHFYFRVSGWGDDIMPYLKKKFKHICKNTTIRKRHMSVTEEYLTNNPTICDYNASSLNIRQDILSIEVTKLAKEAALKAIEEWGQPKSKITHMIFTTVSGTNMPGYDYQLAKLLDLDPSVQRVMLFQQGCHGGGTVLRLAKDIAENNNDARILIVCIEMCLAWFRGPNETDIGTMVGTALFGDGAAACIVGADPNDSIGEQSFFELVSASQSFVPDTEWAIGGQLRECGLTFFLAKENPNLIAQNVEKPLIKALSPLGLGFDDLNSIFWIIHPGGPAIVDKVEAKLGLYKDKLRISRYVLNEFGNMLAASVLFAMDETRKRSLKEGKSTTGDGFEYGVLLGFGPGITIETVVLRSVPNIYT